MTFLLNQYNKKSSRSSAEKQRDERIYFRGTTQLGKCPTQFPVTVKSVCLYTYGSKQRLPGPFIQTAIPDFHLRRLPWMASIRTTLPVLWLCICMSRVYHPRGMVSTGIVKVLRIDRPDGRRVRKFDGAFGPEGCGLPSLAMLIKSALRDLLSVSYGKISILLTGSLRSPPPIRLRRTSPYAGGRIGFYAFLQRHGSMAKYP